MLQKAYAELVLLKKLTELIQLVVCEFNVRIDSGVRVLFSVRSFQKVSNALTSEALTFSCTRRQALSFDVFFIESQSPIQAIKLNDIAVLPET